MTVKKKNAEGVIKDIKQQTRKLFSAEEKIRIVIEGMRGEDTVASICRKYGINDSLYYKWSKDFLEAGKKRLNGDTDRSANAAEVEHLRRENDNLKKALADLYLHNELLKKKCDWLGVESINRKYMRLSQTEKFEIIRLVEQSTTSVNKTLRELRINKPTFYSWYNAYLTDGYDGLAQKPVTKKQFWNQIPESEKQLITELALDHPQKAPREIAWLYTDNYRKYVSESSVYRILKAQGLIQEPAFELIKASDEFKDKTVRPNQMWQTDFTYFKIPGWGWYYLSTVLDDYSRFIVHWKLCSTMTAADATQTIEEALLKSNLSKKQMPKLLSDNGSSYVALDFKKYLESRRSNPYMAVRDTRKHRAKSNAITAR